MLLIVDEDDDTREMLQAALEDEGYEVRTAGDGFEAMEVMQARRPRLVLLDLMMPHMSGWQVVGRMKDDPLLEDIPVCVMTDLPDAAPSDAVCVLTKPVGLEHLLDVVRQHG